jgi:hypothetical protein
MEETDYAELLRPLVAGRRVILAGGVVAGFTPMAELIHRLGAEAILVVGTEGTGSGPPPAPEVASWVATQPTPAESLLAMLRAGHRVLADPPPEMRHAIEAFDPAGTALVIGTFLNESTHLLGRPFLAHRRPEWVALDDKTTVDALWDAVGVARAPAMVIALDDAGAARRASAEVDAGRGTVWAADSVNGWHGGAEGLRWVRRADEIDDAMHAFAAYARRVRIMPFLDGVPCSIHGIVYPDHVVAVRPVEQITLRRVDQPTFFYAGCATYFDPPAAVTDAMRDLARRVGAHLRSTVGFRGAFTVDGVISAAGFRPTELNPRSGAGMGVIQRNLPELPLALLLEALVGGVDLAYDPRQLEHTLVTAADAHRAGGTWRVVPASVGEMTSRPVVGGSDGWRWAAEDEAASGEVSTGPSNLGGFVRLAAAADRTAVGPSFAPAAAAFWGFADRELHTGVGPLEPATAA